MIWMKKLQTKVGIKVIKIYWGNYIETSIHRYIVGNGLFIIAFQDLLQ